MLPAPKNIIFWVISTPLNKGVNFSSSSKRNMAALLDNNWMRFFFKRMLKQSKETINCSFLLLKSLIVGLFVKLSKLCEKHGIKKIMHIFVEKMMPNPLFAIFFAHTLHTHVVLLCFFASSTLWDFLNWYFQRLYFWILLLIFQQTLLLLFRLSLEIIFTGHALFCLLWILS